MEDRHKGIKRWERAKQFAGLEADPEKIGPLAWCRIREVGQRNAASTLDENRIRVYILRIFTKDLIYVHFHGQGTPHGLNSPSWLVRGGIDWPTYLQEVLRHYGLGLPVAEPFQPLRKISPEIIQKMKSLPKDDLPLVFAKLREARFLKPVPILDRNSCPIGLTWDTLRATFQDFLEIPATKDNLPP